MLADVPYTYFVFDNKIKVNLLTFLVLFYSLQLCNKNEHCSYSLLILHNPHKNSIVKKKKKEWPILNAANLISDTTHHSSSEQIFPSTLTAFWSLGFEVVFILDEWMSMILGYSSHGLVNCTVFPLFTDKLKYICTCVFLSRHKKTIP